MMLCILSFSKFHNLPDPATNILIVFPLMRPQATGAVLDPSIRIAEISTAAVSQGIQGTKAEQATEDLRVCPGHESTSTLEAERQGNYYMKAALKR